MSKKSLVILIIFLVLILDQAIKIWVKLNFNYGEELQVLGLDWFLLHFVENDGMAFGLSFGGNYGKLILSLFRLLAVFFLFIYLLDLIKTKAKNVLLIGFALIQAGALGNIIDSAFYGLIFSASPFHGGGTAELFPAGGGYAPLLYGRVVDMFYLPIAYGVYPAWIPWVGGQSYLFFRSVFNVADVAISLGVAVLLVDQLKMILKKKEKEARLEEE